MFISPQPISKQSQLATQTLKLLRRFWGLWSCHFSFCLSRSFSVETFRFSPHLILPPGFQYGTIIFKSHIIKDTHIYQFPLWEFSSLTFLCALHYFGYLTPRSVYATSSLCSCTFACITLIPADVFHLAPGLHSCPLLLFHLLPALTIVYCNTLHGLLSHLICKPDYH